MSQSDSIRVLIVDDDEEDFIIFRDLLMEIKDQRFLVEWEQSYETGKDAILKQMHDIYFIDYRLGAKTGLDLIHELISAQCRLPMILLTGFGEHEVDLEAMTIGAADYLTKDEIAPSTIERSIRYSIHRARTMESLREREAQIVMQDRLASVGLLASSLAHEIGTPLGVIRGRAEYLAMQVQSDETIKKNMDIIISQIDRVSKLIQSLLNLARGDHPIQTAEVNLMQAVNEVIELVGHEFKKCDIRIRHEISVQKVWVRAQIEPLHQVLLNLIVNAIHAIESAVKAGRKGGHFICFSVDDAESNWILNIQDSGCGISEINLRHLFKPFFTTKDIGQGTGLGLATSYRIVESWGGTIQVRSTEGSGSTFQVFLPKVQ